MNIDAALPLAGAEILRAGGLLGTLLATLDAVDVLGTGSGQSETDNGKN